VRATIRNSLPQALRLYGLRDLPADGIDSVELSPGEKRELRFRLRAPGTYLYWARTSRDTFPIGVTEDGQLSGAIVADSAGARPAARNARADDRIFIITLWKARVTPPGTPVERREETFAINGLAWPHDERLSLTVGDTVHWRVINATRRGHPMHLHGFYYRVDARGTSLRDTVYAPMQRRTAVTERMPPGTTMSMTWSPETPGNWLFHCHLVEHISAHMVLRPRMSEAEMNDPHHNHALQAMTGLVLGISVQPRRGEPLVRAEPAPQRRLRLFATERPHIFGDQSAYSFILQEGDRDPAADSMRVPGSTITLTRGEPVAITVLNRAREPVSVHWHGIELQSVFDGVGGWSGVPNRIAPSVAPGDSFVVQFTPRRAGTFIYHTHFDETHQLGAGLYGPLIVLEPGAQPDTAHERILLMGSGGPFPQSAPSLNGDTTQTPLELRPGTTYRLRFISISAHDLKSVRLLEDTVVHRWRAIAKDGAALPPHQATVGPARVLMGPGETWDFEYTTDTPRDLTLEIVSSGRVLLPTVVSRIPVHVRATPLPAQ
jgi:FtsP/CotA-like multicopper oxidase with cupredoxin domain